MKEKYYFARSKTHNLILIYISINLHFFLANSYQHFTDTSTSAVKEFRSLALCIREVSERELPWKPTIVLDAEENQTHLKNDFINGIAENLAMNQSPYVSMKSLVNETFDANLGNYLHVDYFENSEALLRFDYDAIDEKIKYLFILQHYSESFRSGDFQRIGNKVGLKDATFLMKTADAEYVMLTFIPRIDEVTCTETVRYSVKINTCKNGSLMTNVTFPQKHSSDLKRCPFKVGFSELYPFSTIETKKPMKTFDSLEGVAFKGMDVEIIKIISNFFNAKLEPHYIFKNADNPFLNLDYLPFIFNGSLDILAGGNYRMYGDKVQYSGVYARQTIGWVYTTDRLAITWQNLFSKIDGLYLFIVFYVIYSVVWYIISVFDENAVSFGNTLLSSWGALIGTASLQDARSFKQKVLNLVYLLMCLHLSVYISIQFYSFLTIRGPPEILKTNEDIMNSGRKPYLRKLTKHFAGEDKYVQFANTSANCMSYKQCAEMALKYKGVTLMLEGYFIDFQVKTIVNDEARLLKTTDEMLFVYYEMSIYKHSPLATKIQKLIVRLFETGITVKLFNDALGITKLHKTMTATRNIMSNSYSCEEGCSMTLSQISGVFYLWTMGCGLAGAVFLGELLYKKERRNKTIIIFSGSNFKVDKIL